MGHIADDGWDSYDAYHRHLFVRDGLLRMLHCGNGYCKEGLGLAVYERDWVADLTDATADD